MGYDDSESLKRRKKRLVVLKTRGWDYGFLFFFLVLTGFSIYFTVRLATKGDVLDPKAKACVVDTSGDRGKTMQIVVLEGNAINKEPIDFKSVRYDNDKGFDKKPGKYEIQKDGAYEFDVNLNLEMGIDTLVVARLIKQKKDQLVVLKTFQLAYPSISTGQNPSKPDNIQLNYYHSDFNDGDVVFVSIQQEPIGSAFVYPSNLTLTFDCGANYVRVIQYR